MVIRVNSVTATFVQKTVDLPPVCRRFFVKSYKNYYF
nr:MAG TPA: hypothetical protein [Caudoviricetes sp.]